MVELARGRYPQLEFVHDAGERFTTEERFDYLVLSDLVPFAFDLEAMLHNVRATMHERSRLVVHSYSQLWRPLIRIAELLYLKPRKPIHNWVSPGDMVNLLELANLETIFLSREILLPKKIPLLTTFLNGLVARLWGVPHLCLTPATSRSRPIPIRARR